MCWVPRGSGPIIGLGHELSPVSFPGRFSKRFTVASAQGPGSGEFFLDTLQVHPCKLLASFPAGDGPERTPPSLSSEAWCQDIKLTECAGLNDSAELQRQANRGRETYPGAYETGCFIRAPMDGFTASPGYVSRRRLAPLRGLPVTIHVSPERVPAQGCAPKPISGQRSLVQGTNIQGQAFTASPEVNHPSMDPATLHPDCRQKKPAVRRVFLQLWALILFCLLCR
jgi:hypothetical protein